MSRQTIERRLSEMNEDQLRRWAYDALRRDDKKQEVKLRAKEAATRAAAIVLGAALSLGLGAMMIAALVPNNDWGALRVGAFVFTIVLMIGAAFSAVVVPLYAYDV